MDNENYLKLPDLLLMESYNGDWIKYYEEVYKIFKKDFIDSRTEYKGRPVNLKKHPIVDGKECTFYHLTHEGNDENERKPNIRRMERIRWPKFIIKNSEDSYLKIWKNVRKRDKRILIWHTKEKYLLVLADREKYVLPWTAYVIEQNHRIVKLMKEYQAFIKTEPA